MRVLRAYKLIIIFCFSLLAGSQLWADSSARFEARLVEDGGSKATKNFPRRLDKSRVPVSQDVLLSDKHIERVDLHPNQYGRSVDIHLSLTSIGREKLRKFSSENLGRTLALIVNAEVLLEPVIREEISGGKLLIYADLSYEEAKSIALAISAQANTSMPTPVP